MKKRKIKRNLKNILAKTDSILAQHLIEDILINLDSFMSLETLKRHNFMICYSNYGYQYSHYAVEEFVSELSKLIDLVEDEDIKKLFLDLIKFYK